VSKRRDTKSARRFREGAATGRRFVDRGKVRIEWREGGRRRQRTVGTDDEETRQRADAELMDILKGLNPEEETPSPAALPFEQDLRDLALRLLEFADGLAERLPGRSRDAGMPSDSD
jgi:hypothetical protein